VGTLDEVMFVIAVGLALVLAAAVAFATVVMTRRSAAGRPPVAGDIPAVTDVAGAPDPVQVRLERSDLLRRIGDAFDLAVDDEQVHAAAGRSLAHLQRGRRTELLDVDPATGTLRPVARSAGPGGELAACPVRSDADCPSMRRAQVLVAARSDDVDACSFLRTRAEGPCSAACIPVGVDGRTVGVVHVVGPVGAPPEAEELAELSWLAGRTGSALRRSRPVMEPAESSESIASPVPNVATEREPAVPDGPPVEPLVEVEPVADAGVDAERVVDPISGLPGPASLHSRLESLIAQQMPFVLVLADIDELERINRDLGHDAGNESIRALASTLRARGGPDSFAADRGDGTISLVCAGLTLRDSVALLEGVRCDLLDRALIGTAPAFTCSYGITNARVALDATGIIELADAGVRRAKELGGDEIVYADETLSPSS
jgi:diguanylate cyclase (GGDEF)-like protein